MRERRNRKGINTAKVAGWKKAVVLTLALIMCISSIVVPQPEEVSAKQATYIDYFAGGAYRRRMQLCGEGAGPVAAGGPDVLTDSGADAPWHI